MAKTSISSGVKLFQSSMKYRPKRSIVFCSWGSEEHGLIGSEEFVEGRDQPTTAPLIYSIRIIHSSISKLRQ